MSAEKFYVLSLEHSRGGIATWWAPDSKGYTTDLQQAGIYDREAARIACSSRSRRKGEPPPEIAIPTDAPIVIRHTVDLYGQGVKFESFVERFEGSLRTPCGCHGPCGRADCCAECAESGR